jgi:hypothetical protein
LFHKCLSNHLFTIEFYSPCLLTGWRNTMCLLCWRDTEAIFGFNRLSKPVYIGVAITTDPFFICGLEGFLSEKCRAAAHIGEIIKMCFFFGNQMMSAIHVWFFPFRRKRGNKTKRFFFK